MDRIQKAEKMRRILQDYNIDIVATQKTRDLVTELLCLDNASLAILYSAFQYHQELNKLDR